MVAMESVIQSLSFADLLGIFPALNLALAGVLVMLLDAFFPMRSKLLSAWITLIALHFSFMSGLDRLATGMDQTFFANAVRMDAFTHAFTVIICLATTLAVLSAPKYLRLRDVHYAEYYALILFSVSGMVLFSASEELIMLFLALETMSIPVYCLVAFTRDNAYSTEASMKYFLIGAFATGFMVYGIALLYGSAGSGYFVDLPRGAQNSPALFYTGMTLLLIGFLFKIGAVPFNMWTPDAYEGAPTPVTTFMAEAVKAAPFSGLIKLLIVAFGAPEVVDVWLPVFIWIAIVTMTVGNLVALIQSDVKRMLGYSSIAHSGYILVGIVAAVKLQSSEALAAVLFYLFIYVLMNAGAFGILILLSHKHKDANAVDDLIGLGRQRPWAAAFMSIYLLSLTGVPPLGGFFGKFFVFSYAIKADLVPLVIVAILNSVVSAYYYLKIIVAMYFRDASDTGHGRPSAESARDGASADSATGGHPHIFYYEGYSVFLIAMLWITASGVVYYGIFSEGPMTLARTAAASLLR